MSKKGLPVFLDKHYGVIYLPPRTRILKNDYYVYVVNKKVKVDSVILVSAGIDGVVSGCVARAFGITERSFIISIPASPNNSEDGIFIPKRCGVYVHFSIL